MFYKNRITVRRSHFSDKLGEKAAKQIKKKSTKRLTKTNILELDEMCVNFKKTYDYGPQLIEKARS